MQNFNSEEIIQTITAISMLYKIIEKLVKNIIKKDKKKMRFKKCRRIGKDF